MNVQISKQRLKEDNLTPEEFLVLLINVFNVDIDENNNSLSEKGFGSLSLDKKGLIFSENQKNIISEIIRKNEVSDSRVNLEKLAGKLKEIFPKGKKPGSNLYWSESVKLISKRLETFEKKYGNIESEEKVIQAAKNYINSFHNDFRYMKVLKYFIFKDKFGAESIENESDLLNSLENLNEEQSDFVFDQENWDTNLV